MTAPVARRWYAVAPDQLERVVGVDAKQGLDPEEAARRLAREGPNALTERPGPGAFRKFLAQFTDITVIALIVAALIAIGLAFSGQHEESFLERFGDAIAIGLIVVMNAIIGFVQERRAESALRALKDMTAPSAHALRGGKQVVIQASELVVGDVVELVQGDRVPADVRFVEVADVSATEAALTGESTPVQKTTTGALGDDTMLAERTNMAFMGTHIASGRGRAVVVATGMQTELGRIAGMISGVESPDTPLSHELQRFGAYVVVGCVVVGAIVFGVGMWRLDESVGFLLLVAVSLAVAAIPEGLPAITTIVLALGVQRMARRHALVRRLAAVETLGSAHVICTDKTGTLTQNRMEVRRIWAGFHTALVEGAGPGSLESRERPPLLRDAETCEEQPPVSGERPSFAVLLEASRYAPAASVTDDADGRRLQGDPTDAALLALHDAYREVLALRREAEPERLDELPFDGDRKMATVIVRTGDRVESFTHGAPERVLARVTAVLHDNAERELASGEIETLLALVDRWAADGLRVLALARGAHDDHAAGDREAMALRYEHELVLIGFVGIADPPRSEAKAAIKSARDAGVTTVMITGDHPLTARNIAGELGLLDADSEVVTGPELDAMSEQELAEHIPRIRVVARATAANKLQLVQAFEASGLVVAMTGDGVNDAPAIKAASIGIAMGQSGTDVTREAADMVLADDNYATIVHAIEEGRVIYSNIKRFIIFLFAANAGLVLAVFVAAMLGWPAILTPTQILWINLITNGLPALALGMEPVHLDPMNGPPRDRDAPLIDRGEVVWLSAYGAWMGVVGLFVFWLFRPGAESAGSEHALAVARTMTFTVLAFSPLFHALNARSRLRSVFALGFFSNPRLLGSFAVAAGLQALAVYVPIAQKVFGTATLDLRELGIAVGLAATVWVVGELQKLASNLVRGRHASQA